MNYLYHMKPRKIEGTSLIPLNALREEHKSTYESAVSKYQGREHLLKSIIPFLNCLWNDVLHLTAVHPSKVDKALKKTNLKEGLLTRTWFKVNPHILDKENTIVWLYPQDRVEQFRKEFFVPYNVSDLNNYSELHQDTLDYYNSKIQEGKRPLLFHRVPHILYRGTLPLNTLEVIDI